MSRKPLSRQSRQILFALGHSILPLLFPALVYWACGGRSFEWRLALASLFWAAGVYGQLAAIHLRKRRLLIGSAVLYLIGAAFSLTTLGSVTIAFIVLYEGLIITLLTQKDWTTPFPAQVIFPIITVFTGLILTLGVLVIRFAS